MSVARLIAPDIYAFEVDLPLQGTRSANCLVLYCASEQVNPSDIVATARPHFTASAEIETVVILRPAPFSDQPGLTDDIQALLGVPSLRVVLISIGERRQLVAVRNDASDELFDSVDMETVGRVLFDTGLEKLFDSSATIMQSAPGFHFESPSGKHLKTFIRTANMFERSGTTSFVAVAALDLVDIRAFGAIYTDTASINSLGYELARLQCAFTGNLNSTVSIASLGGYSGPDQAPIVASGALVLISVSFTGKYAGDISDANENAGSNPIVLSIVAIRPEESSTYLLAPFTGPRANLIDLSATTWEECPRCQTGHESVVKIDGDQLIPLTPAIRTQLIRLKDGLIWMPKHMQALVELDVPVAHQPMRAGDVASRSATLRSANYRTTFMDLGKVFETTFRTDTANETPPVYELRTEINAQIPALFANDRTHVLFAHDEASEALARYLVYQAAETPPPALVDQHDIGSLIAHSAGRAVRLLVIVAVSSSGRTLHDISRALRPLLSDGQSHIRYFILLARHPDDPRWTDLRTSLEVGAADARRSEVHKPVIEAWLPADRAPADSVWDSERLFWARDILDGFTPNLPLSNPPLAAEIQSRIEDIVRGTLRNTLFLPSESDPKNPSDPLKLNPNFAWWNKPYDPDRVTQAAVYMTFMGVLESRRGLLNAAGDPIRGIVGADERYYDTSEHAHNIRALHPMNFDRYDDAVTQAALLRASLPHELDYSGSPALSASMLSVLLRVSDAQPREQSALAEFLLALAMDRLRIQPRELAYFLSSLPPELPGLLALLADFLRARMNGRSRTEPS